MNKENTVSLDNVQALALGASVLGSGGGGNPEYCLMIAKQQLKKYGPVKLISCDELQENHIVVPIGFMGAPIVERERLINGREFISIINQVKTDYNKEIVLMPGEIGGSNGVTSFIIAGQLGLPVLDGDFMGRAFPELQMASPNLFGISATPAYMADGVGNTVKIHAGTPKMLELIARNVSISFGSSAAVALYIMHAHQAREAVIKGSINRAIVIGSTIIQARNNQRDPIEQLVDEQQARVIASGTIIDIDQSVQDGFIRGAVTIGRDDCKTIIEYQNEYLIARNKHIVRAVTPDIIMILDAVTGEPLSSDVLVYGIRVVVIALAAPAIWKTPQGLALVGPRVFGYDVDYNQELI